MKLLLGRVVIIALLAAGILTASAGWLRGAYALKGTRYLHATTQGAFEGDRAAQAEHWRESTSGMIEGLIDCLLVVAAIAVVSLVVNLILLGRSRAVPIEKEIGQQGVGGNPLPRRESEIEP